MLLVVINFLTELMKEKNKKITKVIMKVRLAVGLKPC
jgi:hypothetical protein